MTDIPLIILNQGDINEKLILPLESKKQRRKKKAKCSAWKTL